MSRDVTSVRADAPIAMAAREMHSRGFKRLPVVDTHGRLVGIVSRSDLLKVFLRSDDELRAEIRRVLGHARRTWGASGLDAQGAARPLKVLANGGVTKALTVRANKFSEAAKKQLEAAGGSVEVI